MNAPEFRKIIRGYMELRDVNGFKDLLRDGALGSYPTFKKKWESPDQFSIGEIDYLIRRLNIRACERPVLKGEADKVTNSF